MLNKNWEVESTKQAVNKQSKLCNLTLLVFIIDLNEFVTWHMTIILINTSSVYQGKITKDKPVHQGEITKNKPNKSQMKQPVTDQPKLLSNNCK